MMKRSAVIVTLVILALAVPTLMLAQQNSNAEKEVRAVIDELKQAQLKGGAEGAAILEKYFADDYVRIFTDGRVFNKAETLGSFRTGKTKYESFEYSDLKIRIYGHTALATAIVKTTGTTYGGSTSPTGVRWTQVFVKRTGKWQPVLTQTTRLAS